QDEDALAALHERVHLAADVYLVIAGVGARVGGHDEAGFGGDAEAVGHWRFLPGAEDSGQRANGAAAPQRDADVPDRSIFPSPDAGTFRAVAPPDTARRGPDGGDCLKREPACRTIKRTAPGGRGMPC